MLDVALLGTFETKAEELAALAQALAAEGLTPHIIDLSLGACGAILPGEAKLARMAAQVEAAAAAIAAAAPSSVVALGGGTGSEMALRIMRELPLALPRFMITTLPFDPRAALADSPVTLIPTLCDIQGMNAALRQIFACTAAMVAGALRAGAVPEDARPSVAVSLLGVTQQGGEAMLARLRAAGRETAAFHANGFGGAALVRFARAGMLSGAAEMTVNEIVRLHVAGAHVPMPERFRAMGHLPRAVLPGALNFLDGGIEAQMPEAWKTRPHYRQSSYFTHVKLTPEEIARAAAALAEDLNASTAPCEIFLPMGGFSSEDRPGGAIEDAGLREIAAGVFEAKARAFGVTRLPFHINTPEAAEAAVSWLLPHLPAKM